MVQIFHFLSQFSNHVGHGASNPVSDFTGSEIDFRLHFCKSVLNCFWFQLLLKINWIFYWAAWGRNKSVQSAGWGWWGQDFPKFGQKSEENPERSQRHWVQHTFLIQLIAFETLFNWTWNSQTFNKQQGGWCLTVFVIVFGPQLLTHETNKKAAEISLYLVQFLDVTDLDSHLGIGSTGWWWKSVKLGKLRENHRRLRRLLYSSSLLPPAPSPPPPPLYFTLATLQRGGNRWPIIWKFSKLSKFVCYAE